MKNFKKLYVKTRSKLNWLTSNLSTKILGGSHGVPCISYFELEILTKNVLQCFQSWVIMSCLEISPLIIFQHLKYMVLPYSVIYTPKSVCTYISVFSVRFPIPCFYSKFSKRE